MILKGVRRMLLIGNGNVLTRDASAPWIRDGAVVTEVEVRPQFNRIVKKKD